jgi:RNA polymerase sigma-70 factor (ECF subfamily)
MSAEPPHLEHVVRTYTPFVLGLASRLSGTSQDIEDIVQDVWVGAVRGLRHLREPAALRGWLASVVVRITFRRGRSRRRRLLREAGTAELESLNAPGPTAEQDLLLRELSSELLGVAAETRAAWLLRHVEGCSLVEIAAKHACSVATAKRRVKRADAALERAFGKRRAGGSPRLAEVGGGTTS